MMVKVGQIREWVSDGTKFEIIKQTSVDIWEVQYENGRHDAHFMYAIDKHSKIISE
jgi:methionine salvage enolase-phosphatase E1